MFSNMTFYTVCLFLAILVSVVFFGYNLSMLLNTYSSFCSKALKYRDLLKLKETDLKELRYMNIVLICLLCFAYTALLFISHLSYLILVMVFVKFLISLYYSDKFQDKAVNGKNISKSLYWQIKLDSLLNLLGVLFLSLLLVRIE
ncbi:MAG: hypothetical protein UHC59_07270 [Fibrobacteraceae bacterium]|jgi:hypothetical protein|nr:hypothetical protein [Fibrobacteraceae bacterium]MEE1276776.1 hypothetical protein [Fibrobacteraceae bacterium]